MLHLINRAGAICSLSLMPSYLFLYMTGERFLSGVFLFPLWMLEAVKCAEHTERSRAGEEGEREAKPTGVNNVLAP